MSRVKLYYRLCMPRRGTKVPSGEFEVLARYFGCEKWREGFPEVWSPPFTQEEAIDVLASELNVSLEEAQKRFKQLIAKRNLIGVYKPSSIRTEITIGEHAII